MSTTQTATKRRSLCHPFPHPPGKDARKEDNVLRFDNVVGSTTTRLLLIDDDEFFSAAMEQVLSKSGFEVVASRSADAGMEYAKYAKPSAILLDLCLPDNSGFQVLENLRSDKNTRDIPVIVITGLYEPNLGHRLATCGADKLMRKPFDYRTLVEELHDTLGD